MAEKLESVAARKLVKEFEGQLHLEPIEAYRATFIVLAVERGWQHARIARYLGVTRHRIGQRVQRYREYAMSDRFPQLSKLFGDAAPKPNPEQGVKICFQAEDWSDLTLARELINRVS